MECSKCGFLNPEQARFCAGCGLAIATIECQHCNAENSPGSRFCNTCGQSLADKTPKKELLSAHAERRILTVLFCDLVDFTKMVDNLDPELSRAIIRDFQTLSKDLIEKLGGRVSTYLGDGIVALFTHHEANAERAINAALQIGRTIDQAAGSFIQSKQKVRVRCGIATGLAVVGDDMLGHSRIRLETAIGLPMNLAARIQSLARPGGIAIDSKTHEMTRGLFDFEDIGSHALKGIKARQKVWRVLAEKSISSRFVAHAAEMTPMVDRTEILQQLMDYWEKSKHAEAQTVIFSGEAGIGKSRITQELCDIMSIDSQYRILEYQCSAYHTHTALYPVISQIKAAAGFEQGDSPADQLDKLEVLVRESSNDLAHDMPVFIDLLSLPADDKWPSSNLDPDERKERIFSTLIDNMFSLSESEPLLIIIEDAHWIDPSTLELVERVVNAIEGHSILFLITSRPGFAPDFLKQPQVTALEVERLPKKYAQQLVDQVKGESNLPGEVQDEIIRRTEGVPLFIEELSKSLMESIASEEFVFHSGAPEKITLPETLQESLLARLDHLPEASKSIAHLAAVIGRDFPYDLLERVADYQDKNLYRDLTPLLKAQMVIQRKAPPKAEFSFKHALVRDVAYETLLKSDLIEVHNRIAVVIEADYPEIAKSSPELVARHFTEGNDYEKAVQYWLAAGKKASQTSANVEARNHLEKGMSLLSRINNQAVKDEFELEFLLVQGPIAISTSGAGSEETHRIYKRALKLSEKTVDSNLRFVTLWNNWRMSINEGFSNAVAWADELQDFAESSKELDQLLQAHHCQWGTLYNLGDQAQCLDHIGQGLKLYDVTKHTNHASIYGGHDPKVCALGQSSLSLWLRGFPEQSMVRREEAKKFADSLSHLGSILHTLDISLMSNKFMANYDGLVLETANLDQLCQQQNLLDYEAKVSIFRGWAVSFLGQREQGLQLITKGVEIQEDTGTWEDRPVFIEMLAEVKQSMGLFEEGLVDIENAIKDASKSGVSYWNAELYRRKGELIINNNSDDNFLAEKAFKKAIEIASLQDAKSLKLRAATSLANMYMGSKQYQKAISTLGPVYDSFTEGLESIDLKNAFRLINSASRELV